MRSVLLLAAAVCAFAAPPAPAPVPNRAPLARTKYMLLPLGSVKPEGWLKQQLRVQVNGLGGNLEKFWPDLGPNSGWLGGQGESWERGPYYMDGLVPLAYLLDDPELIARARRWVGWTLENQSPDGNIGPASNEDWWPRFVMLKVLTQYAEATGDPRVIPLMQKYFAYQAARLDKMPLKEWAVMRWQDEVLSIIWLYNRTGDAKLLDLAKKLHAQGYYWPRQFIDLPWKDKVTGKDAKHETHGVNNSQALKTGAVWWQITNDKSALDGMYQQFRALDQHHLQPSGVHSGDEHYGGRNPSQGTELCSILETMFSLEHIIAATGDAAFGDRLEKIAYNPQPAAYSKDMWAHQYDQQANQVLVSIAPRDWSSNGPDANIYGLEPHFGCCTANMHQGWPKFAANLWMASHDGGLVKVAWAPSTVTSTVRGGVPVSIREETEYPFRGSIRLTVRPERAATFPLELRIPAWADKAEIRVNGKAVAGVRPGTFHRLERRWAKGDKVDVNFPMEPRTSRWYNDSVAVERGPLVFSLKVGEAWRVVKDRPQADDFEVHPTTPWNYALLPGGFTVEERPVGEYPFSPEGAPVVLKAKGRRLPEWTMLNSSAAPPPKSPVSSTESEETLTLIPYGSAKLRITAFPVLVR